MPLVDRWTLMLLDGVVQTAGVVVAIAAIIPLIRTGLWRNPLRDTPTPLGEPDALGMVGVLFGYFMLVAIGMTGLQAAQLKVDGPGSHGWHVAGLIDQSIKLTLCGPIIWLLAREPLFDLPRLSTTHAARLGIACGLAAVPICMAQLWVILQIWSAINPNLEEPVHPVIEALSQTAWGNWGRLQLAIAAVVVAPLAEELLFRGLLLSFLIRTLHRPWLAIAITALAFGMIHTTQPQDVLPLISLGIILGYVRVRYNSLTLCVFAHAVFNSRTIGLLLLNPEAARDVYS